MPAVPANGPVSTVLFSAGRPGAAAQPLDLPETAHPAPRVAGTTPELAADLEHLARVSLVRCNRVMARRLPPKRVDAPASTLNA